MKNYLMFALLIGAASTMAFGQTVTCEGCTHDVSVYMGEGGLIAETDADEVVWVTTCDGVTVSGELEPDAGGKVSMLFSDANGLACHAAGGRLQLGPVMDGGWYWITDDMNSAVGGLVNQEVYEDLKDMTTAPTDAGDGVEVTEGMGAVHLKETATGRVGILPNILPESPDAPATRCSVAKKTSCMLSDGSVRVVAKDDDDDEASSIERPGASYHPGKTLTFRLMGPAGGGFYPTSGTDALGADDEHPLTATFSAVLDYGVGTTPSELSTSAVRGLTLTTGTNTATLTVVADSVYCNASTSNTAKVVITAEVGNDDLDQIVPYIVGNHDSNRDNDDNAVGDTDLDHRAKLVVDVNCPGAASSSSHQGVELVPENPFPTDW